MFRNILANYVGRIWGLISVFIFVPLYIKILGIESYAIINFYTIILTLMYFADAGLSATLNREIARTSDKSYLGNLLFTIERVYLIICIVVASTIFFTSPLIANNWLKSSVISQHDIVIFICLMGFSVAFQLFTTLQNSGLMGLEKQVLSNTIQVSGSIFRSGMVLLPLHFFPSLYTYFIWQLLTNMTIFFITRYQLWKLIKGDFKYKFNREILRTVGRFAVGMMSMAIIASLNTQIDKILISKLLSLKEFGYYSLAGIVSQSPEIIITPIALAILPRMTKFSSELDKTNLIKLFHQYSLIISSVACAVTLVLFLYTRDFVLLWTQNPDIASSIDHVTKALLSGSVFLAFQYMPYYLAISNGHTKSNIRLGIVSIVFVIPILFFCIKRYGLIGAPWPWFAMNLIAYIYLGFFLIKRFLKGEFGKWLINDTLLPLLINIVIGIFFYYLTKDMPKGFFVLAYSAIIGSLSLAVNLFIYNKMNPLTKILLNEIIKDGKK